MRVSFGFCIRYEHGQERTYIEKDHNLLISAFPVHWPLIEKSTLILFSPQYFSVLSKCSLVRIDSFSHSFIPLPSSYGSTDSAPSMR